MEAYEILEHKFAEWIEVPAQNVVACSSGTAALHLACEGLDLLFRSGILMAEFNMIACPRAAAMARLSPIFVDCNADDLLIRPKLLESKSQISTVKSMMLTHVYGRRCDMQAIQQINGRSKLNVIEDMSELHGINPHPDSDAACWSFYKNKIVCGEEGGAVYFKNVDAANKARQLRSLGFTEAHNYLHVPRGNNYRMSNTHAELVLESLKRVNESLARRNEIEDWYDSYLPQEFRQPLRDVVWVYDVRIPKLESQRQDTIIKSLNKQGIACRHGFKPMSMQPEFCGANYKLLEAYKASQEVIYFPAYPSMTKQDVERNVTALLALL